MSRFARPSDVAYHLLLTERQKRDILLQWLWQEREQMGMAGSARGAPDSPLAREILRALMLIAPGGPRPGPHRGAGACHPPRAAPLVQAQAVPAQGDRGQVPLV